MKIAVVGSGLGGCITAMYYGLYNTVDSDVEVQYIMTLMFL